MTIWRNLELVASDLEHDGHIAIGALLDGKVIPIALQKLGHFEAFENSPTAQAVNEQDADKDPQPDAETQPAPAGSDAPQPSGQ